MSQWPVWLPGASMVYVTYWLVTWCLHTMAKTKKRFNTYCYNVR